MKKATAYGLSAGFHFLAVAGFVFYRFHLPKPSTAVYLDMGLVSPSQAQRVVAETPVVPFEAPPAGSTFAANSVWNIPCDLAKPAGSADLFETVERIVPRTALPLPTAISQPKEAPSQAKVVSPPRPVCAIRPDYPRKARRRGLEGDVVLKVCVGTNGSVFQVSVHSSSGCADLDAAAVRAVENARFVPAHSAGRPVAAELLMLHKFRLR